MKRHFFVLNPAAGRKDATEELSLKIQALGLSEEYDICITESVGDAEHKTEEYLRSHVDDFTAVYACGGDGTLSEVANGIYRSGNKNCALGVVPVGSGNDFIKTLDIPADDFLDIASLCEGDAFDMDLLLARDKTGKERVSLNIISAGYDAAVAKGQQKLKKLPFISGSAAYKLSVARQLVSGLSNYFTVLADGERFGRKGNGPYLFCIAANGQYYGGGFKASPFSVINDGMLDLIRIDTVSRLKFIKLVGKFRKGEYINEYGNIVAYTKCKTMQIISEKTVDLNLDGEIWPMNDPIVEIKHNAIKFILPKKRSEER